MFCWSKLGKFSPSYCSARLLSCTEDCNDITLQHTKTVVSQSFSFPGICKDEPIAYVSLYCVPHPAVHRHPTHVDAYRRYVYWRTSPWRLLRCLANGIYLTPVETDCTVRIVTTRFPTNVKKWPHPWPPNFVENPPKVNSNLPSEITECTRQSCSSLLSNWSSPYCQEPKTTVMHTPLSQ